MTDTFYRFARDQRRLHAPLAMPGDGGHARPMKPGFVYLLGLVAGKGALLCARCESEGRPNGSLAAADDVHHAARFAVESAWGLAPAVVRWRLGSKDPAWSYDAIPLPSSSELSTLKDRSYGLALHLAACSSASGLPLPATTLYTAEVSANGKLRGVQGVTEKLGFVCRHLPGVKEVWVARADEIEARASIGDRPEPVVRVGDHVEDVVSAIFEDGHGNATGASRAVASLAVAERDVIVDKLWMDLVIGHQSRPKWDALQRTADALGDALSDAKREKLEDIRSVLARHQGRSIPFRTPSPAYLGTLPRPLRLALLAQCIQDTSDAGIHEPNGALQLARSAIAPPLERHADDFALLGAMARAHAAQGQLEASAQTAEEAVTGFCDVLETPLEASRAMGVWLHAVGALGNAVELERLQRGYARPLLAAAIGAHDWTTVAFTQHGLAVAHLRVWEHHHADDPHRRSPHLSVLRALWSDTGRLSFPAHIALSAGRHLVRAEVELGHHNEAQHLLREFAERTPDGSGQVIFRRLAELDAQLATDPTNADALAELTTRTAEAHALAGKLADRAASTDPVARARSVSVLFPY